MRVCASSKGTTNSCDAFVSIPSGLFLAPTTVSSLSMFDNDRWLRTLVGKIKIWDLQAALDPRSPASSLCINTLTKHTGRVFRLQFDEFQIVSSSHDDSILCFNFLKVEPTDSSTCPSGTINATPSTTTMESSDRGDHREAGFEAGSNALHSQASIRSTTSVSSSGSRK